MNGGEPVEVDLDKARSEAQKAELTLVKSIEIAMQAWQDSVHVKTALDKARNEAEAAADKARKAADNVKKTRDDNQSVAAALAAAKKKSIKTAAATKEAVANAENAVTAVQVAEQAVVEAEKELAVALDAIGSLQEVVRVEATNLKHVRKTAHDATIKAEETQRAEVLAETALHDAEKNATEKQAAAAKAAKKAYTLREEEEEAGRAYDTAATAAEEFEGQGGEWERRTQKTLKERESEYKRIASLLQKANQQEAATEAAADEAQERLTALGDDLEVKKKQAVEAAEAAEENATLLAEAQAVFDKAESAASTAIATHESAEKHLATTRAAAAATTVTKLEEVAAAAKEEESRSKEEEERLIGAFAGTKEAMEKAVVEAESTKVAAAEKHAHAEKVAEREHEAEAKEVYVKEHLVDFENKVHALALATYASRMGAPAYWTREEAETTAEGAAQTRRATASNDQRAVATASKDKHLDLTVVDKWRCFKQWAEENSASIDMWIVKRVYYNREGEVLSGINVMVADIVGSALDRGPPDAKQCAVSGEGLSSATIAREATFKIVACSSHGIRFEDGGDKFTVNIRFAGQCARVMAKIVDNNDGSYTVTYVPRATGVCTISVSLAGEPLPKSPFSCLVAGREGHKPCAAQCSVSGDALTKVVAHNAECFYIDFRDARGNIAHASDLDVWIQPIDPTATGGDSLALAESAQEGLPSEVSQLLLPPGAFDSFVVGATALDVSRTPDQSSLRIGRLPPGRTLKLGKIEPPTEDGVIRACVRLELEDLEPKDSSTWRDLWPQQQPWRSLSWRAHRIAEAKREDEEQEAMAVAYALHLQVRRQEAACVIESHYRGKQARLYAGKLHLKRRQALKAAAEAAERAEGIFMPPPPMAQAGRGKKGAEADPKGRGARRSGKEGKEGTASPKGGKKQKLEGAAPAPAPSKDGKEKKTKAPAPAEADTKPASKADAKADAESDSMKAKKPSNATKDKKGKKGKANEAEAEEAAAAALDKDAALAKAATRLQAAARGKAARKSLKSARAAAASKGGKGEGDGSGATTSKAKGAKGKKPAKSARSDTRRQSPDAQAVAAAAAGGMGTAASGTSPSAAGVSNEEKRAAAAVLAASPRLKLPSPRLNLSAATEQMFGWVTLATSTECFVVKQTGRLPVHLRQQHEQHWTRRNTIDSARELEKAKQREHTLLDKVKKPKLGIIPHDHHYSASMSPRMAYWDDVANDPKRIGFAYGGVYPGRLHAKGQLVETHEVHFSVGICGDYHLYINLRQPHTPWAAAPGSSPRGVGDEWVIPGSPFTLRVAPGKPYPLTTVIPSEKLPLRGDTGSKAPPGTEVYAIEYVLQARDKMGNACDAGGAEVTCGFFDAAAEPDVSDHKPEAEKPTGEASTPGAQPSAPADDTRRGGTVVDVGDGTYRLRWVSPGPGIFDFFVKMDGLHVLGSPSIKGLMFVGGGLIGGSRSRGSVVTPPTEKSDAPRTRVSTRAGSVVAMPQS